GRPRADHAGGPARPAGRAAELPAGGRPAGRGRGGRLRRRPRGRAGGRRHPGGPPRPPRARRRRTVGNRRDERVLNVYNWSDYIDDRTIPLFQALTNLRVNYDVYSSNEDLLARMRSGPAGYDIIVPTSWFIPTYMKLDLIEPLRQDLMPNLTNLDKEFVETDDDPRTSEH